MTDAEAACSAASVVCATSASVSACVSSSPHSADANDTSEGSVKRSETTAEEKLRVLSWYHANGCNQRRTAAHFRALEPRFKRLSQATVSRWLLSENKFKKLVQSRQSSVIRQKSVRHPQVERCLTMWLDWLPLNQYIKLTGKEVKDTTRRFYECLGTPQEQRLELSNGWLSRFQARHGLKLQKTQRRISADSLEMEQLRLQRVVEDFLAGGGTLHEVWNMDETSFFYDCCPVVAEREVDLMEKVRKRLTVTLATSATGSKRLEPMDIAHDSQEGDCAKFYNSTAWMTGDIFCVWLKMWNQELVKGGRRVLLLVDKSRSHKADLAGLTNIQLEYFSPVVTDFVQPCYGLSDAFHTNYRHLVAQRALGRLRRRTDCGNLFEINLSEAVALAKRAWQNVEMSTIAACWMQAQIIPVEHAEKNHEAADLSSQMTNTPLVKDLQELQLTLNVLSAECQMQQLSVTLHSAADFVALDLDTALGLNLSISEIVEMVRRDDNLNGKSLATGSKDDINKDTGNTRRTEVALSDKVSALAPTPTLLPCLTSTIDPSDVLNSLVIMENHWRATGTELPNDMIDLLASTRENLQHQLASSANLHG